MRELTGIWLGRRRYAATHALQVELFELRKQELLSDVVLCLEHEPVLTLGRGAKPEHLLTNRDTLRERGIDVEVSDRGGEITVHAPGQLVCYPILRLSPERCDVRRYVKDLQFTMGELIAPSGLQAGEMAGLVGLWVDTAEPSAWPGEANAERPEKIGAIGVRLSRWVTMHGFALNLDPDLSLYRLIVPCGVTRYGVCSVKSLRDVAPSPASLAPLAWRTLAERLGRTPRAFLDASEVAEAALARWIAQRLQATGGDGGRLDVAASPLT